MSETENKTSLPLIGQEAPAFKAASTQGPVNFPQDYSGKWVVLFSHPADFTPVCTTEFMGFQDKYADFKVINTELVGYSVDGVHSHIEWARNIQKNFDLEIEFPIVAGQQIAHLYGMLHAVDSTHTVRAVFVINPEGKIAAIMYYPLSNGRSIAEIYRLVKALQKTHDEGVATPENWPNNKRLESDVIIPPADSMQKAVNNQSNTAYKCYDWYLCTRKES